MFPRKASAAVLILFLLLLLPAIGFARGKAETGAETATAMKAARVAVTVWDQFGYEGTTAAGPAMDKLVAAFEQQNPGIDIQRTVVPQAQIRDQLRIAVAGGQEPNMFYTWPAAAVLASYARGGSLRALDDAARQYGWTEELPELEVKRVSYRGHMYAYPFEQDYMLVYYNKDLFQRLGIQVPRTYQEFQQNCETIKQAGLVPIAFGNRGKWPATNTLSYLLALVAGKQRQEEVLFGDTPWTNEAYVEAAQTFLDWADRGYFPRGFNGIDYGEANSLFTMGQAAMTVTGTWVLQDMVAGATDFELGTFMLPAIKPDLPKATMMGEGSQWSISARGSAQVHQAAVQFLAFLASDDNIKVWVEEGYVVPIRKGGLNWDQFDVPEVVKSTFIEGDALQEVNGYDLHTTVPESVTETLYNNLQLMLDKNISPMQFLQAMQASWEKAKAAGEVWVP